MVEALIARWQGREGGQERANYALFLTELCDAIGVERPDPAASDTETNEYVFERVVREPNGDGTFTPRWIDLYKRDCFIMEAKQSRHQGGKKEVQGQADLFTADEPEVRGRRTANRAWDVLMMNARQQAQNYARCLPANHGWPPFILVCDVGHCIEVYADFSGQGRNYAQFPDRQGFRIYLEDLRQAEVRERLRAVWADPRSLDPARHAARATREIATRLAAVSRALEKQRQPAEEVAMFLMRCLFTMFAQSVGLLPQGSFKELLAECEQHPSRFVPMVGQLWEAMDQGGFAFALKATVRRFNGEFFQARGVMPLGREEIGELRQAAERDWHDVEPAIFGTLLEQALDPAERRRLGAHYTPRAYVERLVVATVIEPLRESWAEVLSTAERQKGEGRTREAAATVRAFHDRLCQTRVLDPACGTGNFLYVALELMKRLEGEVLEALTDLGGQEALSGLEGHTIDPRQFLGLEVNPRAAAIAELVLWIGYLQWHFRTKGAPPAEPVLRAFKNIVVMDAVLQAEKEPACGAVEAPERVYKNPRRPDWPPAEFIVGNPPFIGGKDLRARLGDGYAEALWAAHPQVNESADYVIYWWDRAAELLTAKGTSLRRFGLVTTNSISQVFQRRTVARHIQAKRPISLVMAIPDHPWTKATREAAAVRIAMTVAVAGTSEGKLLKVDSEEDLNTDQPTIKFIQQIGIINADLTIGLDLTAAKELKANEGLCSPGVKLHGAGFIVTPQEARHLGLGRRAGLEKHIREYRNGRDLTFRPRGVMAIDLDGLSIVEVQARFPEVYQHLVINVKSEREKNNEEYRRVNWWLFGRRNTLMRGFTKDLDRYIVTVETMKHRLFEFLPRAILPDNRLVCFGMSDAFFLGVLSSRVHTAWALANGGTLEDRPIYTKSRCFDPFPFPQPSESIADEIRAIADELDAHRKKRLAEHNGITLTAMYNVLELLRTNANPKDLDDESGKILDRGLIVILKELHERLDATVLRAYGWPEDLDAREILSRLLTLNRERTNEERAGQIRWLRPDYQIPRFGTAQDRKRQLEADLQVAAAREQKPLLPRDDMGQTAAVMAALASASRPMDAATVAAGFRQGRQIEPKVRAVLMALARTGFVASTDGGKSFSFRRVA
jgi:hypothetical protein